MKISLIVGGGGDTYYELGLTSGLVDNGITVDLIGSDSMKTADIIYNQNVNFFNLRGDQSSNVPLKQKILRILKYYVKLLKYSIDTDTKVFHIQWIGKFEYFERIFLILYYKILGKKIVFTAHNINAGIRDGNDTILNRITLKFLYQTVDRIIVHTKKMKRQLIEDFNISEHKIEIVKFGINNVIKTTKLTELQARMQLGFNKNTKIILFFGIISPYKGLEYLILSLIKLREKFSDFKLIIAGKIDVSCKNYWTKIQRVVHEHNLSDLIFNKIEFISEDHIENYFKAADVLVLPYNYIYQSGILFISFNFGLPVIATDVGSMKEYIIVGETGYICQPQNPEDLAEKLITYFHSDLYNNLKTTRERIKQYANEQYSWERIGEKTRTVYQKLL